MLLLATLLLLNPTPAGPASPAHDSVHRPAAPAVAASLAGRVLNSKAEPLPGVYVSVRGTAVATSTNSDGDFLLALPGTAVVLVFQCYGYRDHALAVTGSEPLTVTMSAVTAAVTADEMASAATARSVGNAPNVLKFAEVMPQFPGGETAYLAYIRQNAHYPKEASLRRASGTVFVGFVVDEQGRITNAEVVKGAGHGLDEEALRLVRLMPWWSPGLVAGRPVKVSQFLRMPFVFKQG